ncbi:MAG: type II toxin-antitoxin system Phd/YefM family antitoxin [Spirochaetaceae bacterium]|nr:MAG: type II toxin-antitoxin system Phd/YefM family antitoxin [Spirochaetaceae bacterium]
MTKDVPLYEAKAHLSAIVRRVAETGQEVMITVRGKPTVRIVPAEESGAPEDAWTVRERVEHEYGLPDYQDPPEPEVEQAAPPLFPDEL